VEVRVWWPRYVVDTVGGGQVAFPQLRDVAVRLDASFPEVWATARDGTLWRHGAGPWPPDTAGQEPGPGNLTRLAIALDGSVWAVTPTGAVWHHRMDGAWTQVPANLFGALVDVTVWQGTAWVVRDDGSMWQTVNGVSFVDKSILLPMKRVAAGNHTEMWGITTHGQVMWMANSGNWFLTEGIGREGKWEDLSISEEGTAWLVRDDGTIWSTRDGVGYERIPGEGFSSISAGRFLGLWAVKTDGTLWAWNPAPPSPVSVPPPPPATTSPGAPSPSSPRPQIAVSTSGSGAGSIFHVTGSRFLANAQVTIRGARIGADGAFNYYWMATASPSGSVDAPLQIPCISGITISFSANDGRPDPTDLTNRFWSNTADASCP
jgi:hypothetical protein